MFSLFYHSTCVTKSYSISPIAMVEPENEEVSDDSQRIKKKNGKIRKNYERRNTGEESTNKEKNLQIRRIYK